jgi:hypothetical protein
MEARNLDRRPGGLPSLYCPPTPADHNGKTEAARPKRASSSLNEQVIMSHESDGYLRLKRLSCRPTMPGDVSVMNIGPSGACAVGYARLRRIGTAPVECSSPYFLYLSYLYVQSVSPEQSTESSPSYILNLLCSRTGSACLRRSSLSPKPS